MSEKDHPKNSAQVTRARPLGIQWRLARGVTTGDIQPNTEFATTGFNAHGSYTIAAPRVVAIYWGRDWGSPATGMNGRAITMDRFLATVMTSRYLDNLAQYSSGRGTFVGSTWVDHDPDLPQSFTFDDVGQVLVNWINAGLPPAVPDHVSVTRDLVYVIFASSEIILTANDGSSHFCAYHYFGTDAPYPFLWIFAVVDSNPGDSAAVSHELAEAFTDPTHDGWYSDVDNGEIGDVCSCCGCQALTLGEFKVASYWLVQQNRCLQQSDLIEHPDAIVPDVVGMAQVQAEQAITSVGFVPRVQSVVDHTCNSIGMVVSQAPVGGTSLMQTSAVTIFIGRKPPHPCP